MNRSGKGLLDRDLLPVKNGADKFEVLCSGFTLTAKPKSGELFADSALMGAVPTPCNLHWFRRMSNQISTHDKTQAAPRCNYYCLGLEHNGQKLGWRIFEDGTAVWGTD